MQISMWTWWEWCCTESMRRHFPARCTYQRSGGQNTQYRCIPVPYFIEKYDRSFSKPAVKSCWGISHFLSMACSCPYGALDHDKSTHFHDNVSWRPSLNHGWLDNPNVNLKTHSVTEKLVTLLAATLTLWEQKLCACTWDFATLLLPFQNFPVVLHIKGTRVICRSGALERNGPLTLIPYSSAMLCGQWILQICIPAQPLSASKIWMLLWYLQPHEMCVTADQAVKKCTSKRIPIQRGEMQECEKIVPEAAYTLGVCNNCMKKNCLGNKCCLYFILIRWIRVHRVSAIPRPDFMRTHWYCGVKGKRSCFWFHT